MTVCYLLLELDEFFISEWNPDAKDSWPKFSIPYFEETGDAKMNLKTQEEKLHFSDETISLSKFLQKSLQVEDELGQKSVAADLLIALRFASLVAKKATIDTSDFKKVKVEVALPWKKCQNRLIIHIFAADTYRGFMDRLERKILKHFGENLATETVLHLAARPKYDNDVTIYIPHDDNHSSLNDLYLLLQGLEDDNTHKEIKSRDQRQQRQKEFYRLTFTDPPKVLLLLLKYTILSTKGTKLAVILRPRGDEKNVCCIFLI